MESSIVSLTTFDPQVKARTGYWTSFIKGSDKVNNETGVLDNRRDLIKIEIFKQVEDQRIPLEEASGSYLENITF
jgi:hypothetical protein